MSMNNERLPYFYLFLSDYVLDMKVHNRLLWGVRSGNYIPIGSRRHTKSTLQRHRHKTLMANCHQ